ncbi:MAG: LamG-like jellyroll fold domain-containing protein [Jejuia sp.]
MAQNSKESNPKDDITFTVNSITINQKSNTNNDFGETTLLRLEHNNGELIATNPITKNFSSRSRLSTVLSVIPIERIWTITNTNNTPTVSIKIPKSIVDSIYDINEEVVMVVSDDYDFTTNVTSTTLKDLGTELQGSFYFEGIKYVTFGTTSISEDLSRALAFDGSDKYLTAGNVHDLSNINYTISAWIKRGSDSKSFDIISKRDYQNNGSYNHGYALSIDEIGKFSMNWKDFEDLSNNKIEASSTIPENQWHHVAVSYNLYTNITTLYIDGIKEAVSSILDPINTSSDSQFIVGAANYLNRHQHCNGNIDEIRIWDVALSENQIRYIMNQEIVNNSNFVSGKILPNSTTKNEIRSIPWDNLIAYYPINRFVFGSTKDESKYGNDLTMINYADLSEQTAPLPYKTTKNGNWNDASTWLNGDVQYIPGINSCNSDNKTIDYNIVEIDHEITLDNSEVSLIPASKNKVRTLLGLTINTTGKLIVDGDNIVEEGNGLEISHYLKLDGKIDLEGESQLIQTDGSDLDVTSCGSLERDQQGTRDLYSYNHWSAPVGVCNTSTNNNSYNLSTNILKNGTLSDTPKNIRFLSSSYNGNVSGTDIEIADFWIWKYTNLPSANYATWQHVRSSGTIKPGEGFTMKGVESSANSFVSQQNYVFEGKPFNGDISVTVEQDNEYLVGNPYASAINADEFIKDNISNVQAGGRNTNGNVINGALYFWDHFGSGSHTLDEYEGGYSIYTLMGGVPALNHDNRINATGIPRTKSWGRHIPVGQGFFVTSILDTGLSDNVSVTGGQLLFKNSQRVFQKESETNEASDNSKKIRLIFDSPDGYHRQILLGENQNCTSGFDLGYDAPLIENNKEDMYWTNQNGKLVIQAIEEFTESTSLPIGIKINKTGVATITLDSLENIETDLNVIIHDTTNNTYHDLSENPFEILLEKGVHGSRLEVVLTNSELLNVPEIQSTDISINFIEEQKAIQIINSKSRLIKSLEVYNVIGQNINDIKIMSNKRALTFRNNHISGDGIYIVKVYTDEQIVTKKFIVRG